VIEVSRAGPLTTVQDLGRPGYAHLGVPRSGALDVPALCLANALVGNPAGAAGLETTMLGCRLRFTVPARVAVTGATATIRLDGREVPGVVDVPAGGVVEVGRAVAGVRSYVAVAGGIDVEPVLGSRSTDTLSGLGPPRLVDGMTLPIGPAVGGVPGDVEPASAGVEDGGGLVVGVRLGPRDGWFVDARVLFAEAYTISPVSNRVGARLAGRGLTRAEAGELPPEGVVLGAIQVPADGQPLIFLADHPVTGGYPVIGVVADVTPLAQARPGTAIRFRPLD
jgi:biotin-dependent carboxylase-like uncharacterized protein